ncbi:MAG: carbon starvation protein A [Candidatus Omnitrophica bacterium]|nr:carbon starvation protein A [Candidatus Omnitrophota bacterium]
MNSLIVVFISGLLLFWGYRFYAKKLEPLWSIDPKRPTPAYSKYDSIDYIPARNWLVLFGHHFASIAGAGPIVGPVIAVMLWGWLPALIWIILGTIFIGGVHDFGSLVTSLRENGSSVADIASKAISKKAKIIFSLFVWLALILVIAVFAYLCADIFVKEPKIVLPSLGLIPVAMVVGYLMYRFKVNSLFSTILGLVLMVGLLYGAKTLTINMDLKFWFIILFIYAYIASVLPVNILLQPRDYLSSFLLFFGLAVGYIGLFLRHPCITLPACHSWESSEGALWPLLFVTIACGAISGFHSLIASGTTSKQLPNERYAKRIGYGAMVTEALMAVLSIMIVITLFRPEDNLKTILKELGPMKIYGKGYALITDKLLGNQGAFLGMMILNAFILTTLDTATRIARYLTEELFRIKNHYLSTLIIVGLSAGLAMSGKWNRLWPVFGTANQLVAALVLFVLTCWLLSKGKPIRFTIWPAVFMLVITVSSLILGAIKYFSNENKEILLFIISVILVILACFMFWEVMLVFRRIKRNV